MEISLEEKVSTLLEKVRRNIAEMEMCSKKIASLAHTHFEKTMEWKNENVGADDKHSALCQMAMRELIEARDVEKNTEKRAISDCTMKTDEEMRMQESFAEAKAEVDTSQNIVKDKMDEKKSLEDVNSILCDRIKTRQSAVVQRESRLIRKEKGERDLIDKFETILGLKVEAVEDQALLLTFTNIDSDDPESQYMVTVKTTDDKTYEAMNCQPPIAEFEHLSDALRRDELKLPQFVKQLRELFVRYANPSL